MLTEIATAEPLQVENTRAQHGVAQGEHARVELRLQTREAVGDDLKASSIAIALAVALQEKDALTKGEELPSRDPLPNGGLQDEDFARDDLLASLLEKNILGVLEILLWS